MSGLICNRRRFVGGCLVSSLALASSGAWALLLPTPRQTEGPFYPDRLPLDRDNDLVRVDGAAAAALGTVVQMHGRILDTRGEPLNHALVEIWQVDSNGIYLHSHGGDRQRRDGGFQGYGQFETASSGEYRFRTIRPVAYSGRTPHIHVAVTLPGRERFTTQCYIRGEPRNAGDFLFRRVDDPRERELLQADFLALADGSGEQARFDIVLGVTPAA
ncbi:Protocatechuate 3,4-dioxygenase beta chain [compost metagenome]